MIIFLQKERQLSILNPPPEDDLYLEAEALYLSLENMTGLEGTAAIAAALTTKCEAALREAVAAVRAMRFDPEYGDVGSVMAQIGNCIDCHAEAIERLIGEPASPPGHDPALRDVHGIIDQIDLDKTTLPCDVRLPPATVIAKGCSLRTVITGLQVRGMKVVLAGEPAPRSSPVTQDELMDCYQYGTVKGEPAP